MLLKEREYYKPFKYPWAFENYKKQQQMHWLPDEVPLQDDIKDYREKLSEGERTLLDNIFTLTQLKRLDFFRVPLKIP